MRRDGNRIVLSADESMLAAKFDDAGQVHCFINPGAGMLIGADWKRDSFDALLSNAEIIEIAGESAKGMQHALAVTTKTDLYFFASHADRIADLESPEKDGDANDDSCKDTRAKGGEK